MLRGDVGIRVSSHTVQSPFYPEEDEAVSFVEVRFQAVDRPGVSFLLTRDSTTGMALRGAQ